MTRWKHWLLIFTGFYLVIGLINWLWLTVALNKQSSDSPVAGMEALFLWPANFVIGSSNYPI